MAQQTILRVETGRTKFLNATGVISDTTISVPVYSTLDLYTSAPIKINKSFAEIQDIDKKNSDYSVPLSLPASKKNNRFFETFYNVDQDTLFFDPTQRVECQVLIDDQVYFKGYLKLNKVAVKESKVEYNVTLYSQMGEIFGLIGNNLLSDMNFTGTGDNGGGNFGGWNSGLTPNTTFDQWQTNIFNPTGYDKPPKFFFPVVHNGYVYDEDTGLVDYDKTRLYTSTIVGAWPTAAAAISAGTSNNNLNSPGQGLFINQLKPALSIYWLVQKIFATYGYSVKSEFKETPWFKQLYTYGYFSSENVLFAEKQPPFETRGLSDVTLQVTFPPSPGSSNYVLTVCKKGTGVPCYCDSTITVELYNVGTVTIQPFTVSYPFTSAPVIEQAIVSSNVDAVIGEPYYTPTEPNTEVIYTYGDTWNLNKVIDPSIKQIDILSSLAKKFNLVFVPDPDSPNTIIMEPIQYYIGSGEVRDWNGKLSYDQGFTVEPAQNFVESEIILSDAEDEDGGNAEFQRLYSKRYGEKKVYSKTEFKSRSKKIETIFSPEVLRRWDLPNTPQPNGDISLPLGINYSESSSDRNDGQVDWTYGGLRSKPKLFYYVDNASPFIDSYNEFYSEAIPYGVNTITVKISEDGTTNSFLGQADRIPIISHTSPIGNPDQNKIVNDTASVLFGSESALNIGVEAFSAFTKFDAYNRYYENYVNNLFGKNTRFIKGKFQLNLDDILNIQPKDLIKIKEQYFTYNKISGYDLTSPQLTEVELVQFNNTVQEYPTRYFQYYYGDNQAVVYKFNTDMVDPDFSDTNWGRSVRYDYFVGILISSLGGLPSSVVTGVLDPSQGVYPQIALVPQYWYEVTKDTYESSGISRDYDPLYQYVIALTGGAPQGDLNVYTFPIVASQVRTVSGQGYLDSWLNLYTDLSDFNTKATTYNFINGSSTTHTAIPTATPTSTPLPSPTPTGQEEWGNGSLVVSFDELEDPSVTGGSRMLVSVNGNLRFERNEDITNGYATYLNDEDLLEIRLYPSSYAYNMIVREFTNDNADGDNGIKEYALAPSVVVDYGTSLYLRYLVSSQNENCTFELRFSASNVPTPTPGPTPFPTPTPTACWKCDGSPDLYYINFPVSKIAFNDEDLLYVQVEKDPDNPIAIPTRIVVLDTSGCPLDSVDNQIFLDFNRDYLDDLAVTYTGILTPPWTVGTTEYYVGSYLSSGTFADVSPICSDNSYNPTGPVYGPITVLDSNYDGALIRKTTSDYTGYDPLYNETQLSGGTGGYGYLGQMDDESIIVYDKIATPGFTLRRIDSNGSATSGWNIQVTHRQVNPNFISGESGKPFGSTELAGGSIMIYGNFHYYGPLIAPGTVVNLVNNCDSVVKVQSNGLTDTSFTGKTFTFFDFPVDPSYVDAMVSDVAELSDGSLIFVGQFSTYDGVQVGGLLKTDSQGNLDYTFKNNVGTAFGLTPGGSTVRNIAIDSNDRIAISGAFTEFNGNTSIKYLILLDKDGNNLTCNYTPAPTATPSSTPFPTATPQGTPYPTPFPTATSTPLPTATAPAVDPDGYMTNMSWCDGEYICENAIQQVGPYIHMNTPFVSDSTTCNPVWTTLSNCIDVGNFITYPTIQTEGWYALTHIPNSYVDVDPFVIFYILTTGEIVSSKQCTNGNVVGWPSDQPPFDDSDVTPTPVPGCTNQTPVPSPTPSPTPA
tara:strand:- start:6071 stop:11113 length:5043 start_codon:yes stop_codon:yes gene_type:complete